MKFIIQGDFAMVAEILPIEFYKSRVSQENAETQGNMVIKIQRFLHQELTNIRVKSSPSYRPLTIQIAEV